VADLAPQGRDTIFPEDQKEEFSKNPDKLLAYRKRAEATMNHFFDLQIKESELQKVSIQETRSQMEKVLVKRDLAERLIPSFALGCRR